MWQQGNDKKKEEEENKHSFFKSESMASSYLFAIPTYIKRQNLSDMIHLCLCPPGALRSHVYDGFIMPGKIGQAHRKDLESRF